MDIIGDAEFTGYVMILMEVAVADLSDDLTGVA